MKIPRIIHQLWKTEDVPKRWRAAVDSVKRYHKGWEYRLWTDVLIDDYVRTRHSRFYPVFAGMNRHIMRIDVFRYVLMHDLVASRRRVRRLPVPAQGYGAVANGHTAVGMG